VLIGSSEFQTDGAKAKSTSVLLPFYLSF